LRILLIQALQGWLVDEEAPYTMAHTSVAAGISRIVQEQNSIGWSQIFNGRFSGEWGRLQDEYYARLDTNQRNKYMTGDRWQVTIISCIWDEWYKLWELRNKDLHGADEASRHAAARLEVERTLDDIYAMREHLDPGVRTLLRGDVAEHREESVRTTRNWIAVHGQLFSDNVRRATERANRGMRSIRSYFGRVT
jgi:hypothetical protein